MRGDSNSFLHRSYHCYTNVCIFGWQDSNARYLIVFGLSLVSGEYSRHDQGCFDHRHKVDVDRDDENCEGVKQESRTTDAYTLKGDNNNIVFDVDALACAMFQNSGEIYQLNFLLLLRVG